MSVAGENSVSRRAAAPSKEQQSDLDRHNGRELKVVEGRLDLAARLARFLGTTLLVTFIVGLVGALVLHATIIEDQRDLDAQKAQIARLGAETEALRHELAELEAPARIVDEARRLGMIEAPAIVYLNAPGEMLDDRTLSIAANQLQASG